MENNNLPEEIFDLLASKSLEELNIKEKALVAQHLPLEEYQEMRAAIANFQQLDQSVSPRFIPFEVPKEEQSLWKSIAYFPIPAYVAASIALLMALGFVYLCRQKTPSTKNTIQVKQKGTSIEEEPYPENLIFNL
jgi:hypothetical protein